MADKKQIGVYFGPDAVYFVPTTEGQPSKIFEVPINKDPSPKTDGGTYIPAGMQLSSAIQAKFKEHKISGLKINLALPATETIIRTFVIPWMQNAEVKGVVEFEASKYIPFSLEELSFSYEIIPFTDKAVKRLRIIFIAIKKEALTNYNATFEQAALTVHNIEPAPNALIRVINEHDQLPKDDTIAIIDLHENSGKLIIVQQSIPLFVRDFQLTTAVPDGAEISDNAFRARLTSEIRISLDYFNRQDRLIQVKEVFIISAHNVDDITEQLQADLNLKVSSVLCSLFFPNQLEAKTEHLNALGAGLFDPNSAKASFNLSSSTKTSSTDFSLPKFKYAGKYKKIVNVTAGCIVALIAVFFLTKRLTDIPQARIDSIHQELGMMADLPEEDLKAKAEKVAQKFDQYKKIRLTTDSVSLFKALPDQLPEHAWLETIELSYANPPIYLNAVKVKSTRIAQLPPLTIYLKGFVYNEDSQSQFTIANQFPSNLKENTLFNKLFKNIDLQNIRAERLENNTVTSFKIKCH